MSTTVAPLVAPAPTRAEPLDPALLHDIAAGIATATTLWRPLVQHDAEQRRPVRLLATERYEVWVIGWAPGQSAELHDHGDSAGALLVVDGDLEEDVVVDGSLRTFDLPAGTDLHLTIGLVHEVVNRSDRPATSIHVYSPPLSTMTRYDPETLRATMTEAVFVEEPAYGVPAETVMRHPSVRG